MTQVEALPTAQDHRKDIPAYDYHCINTAGLAAVFGFRGLLQRVEYSFNAAAPGRNTVLDSAGFDKNPAGTHQLANSI